MPRISLPALCAVFVALAFAAPAPAHAQPADECIAKTAEAPSWPFRQLTGFSLALSKRHADGAMTDAQYDAAMGELSRANELLAGGNVDGACAALGQLRARYNLPGNE